MTRPAGFPRPRTSQAFDDEDTAVSTEQQDRLITGPKGAGAVRRGETPRPGVALVFSLDDGEAVVLPRRPSLWESPRYHYRYEVDITDHSCAWREELPSGTAGFAFEADINARWRVSAPDTVVRRSISTVEHGEHLVRGALGALLRAKVRKYDIEDAPAAEEAVSHLLVSRDHMLDCGITVFGCTLRLGPGGALEPLQRRRKAEWEKASAKQRHGLEMQRGEHENQQTALRARALREAARGEGGLLLHLIAQDPRELRSILQEMAERQDIAIDRKHRILHDSVAQGLLLPAEASELAAKLLDQELPFGNGSHLPPVSAGRTPPALPGGAAPMWQDTGGGTVAVDAGYPSMGATAAYSVRATPAGPPASGRRHGNAASGLPPHAAASASAAGAAFVEAPNADPAQGDAALGPVAAGPGDGVVGWKPVGRPGRSASDRDEDDA